MKIQQSVVTYSTLSLFLSVYTAISTGIRYPSRGGIMLYHDTQFDPTPTRRYGTSCCSTRFLHDGLRESKRPYIYIRYIPRRIVHYASYCSTRLLHFAYKIMLFVTRIKQGYERRCEHMRPVDYCFYETNNNRGCLTTSHFFFVQFFFTWRYHSRTPKTTYMRA